MRAVFGMLIWWGFIVIKLMGTSLAAWSWWWLLLPIIPDLWLALSRLGLLR